MKTLVDQYTDRYFDPRRGQVIGVNYSPNGQAIEYELGLVNGKRMAGDALGIGIDGLSDLLYREKPRQLTPGELNDFFGGMDPGDLGPELVALEPRKEPAKRTLPALRPDGSIDFDRFITHTFGTPLDEIEKNVKDIEDMYKSGEFEIEPYRDGDEVAGFQMPADLSYPRGRRGDNFEGVPNANDPVMREKLRNRRLRNPAGGEDLPGFLGRV